MVLVTVLTATTDWVMVFVVMVTCCTSGEVMIRVMVVRVVRVSVKQQVQSAHGHAGPGQPHSPLL